MKVIWTPESIQDRNEIWNYIAADNWHAASQLDELFSVAAAKLVEYPNLGHKGQIAGTRELIPHENYRLVYEIQDEIVWVLAIVHTAKRWPPIKK